MTKDWRSLVGLIELVYATICLPEDDVRIPVILLFFIIKILRYKGMPNT